jgi:hypothetical protein
LFVCLFVVARLFVCLFECVCCVCVVLFEPTAWWLGATSPAHATRPSFRTQHGAGSLPEDGDGNGRDANGGGDEEGDAW